jgi:hypothetical protein
MSASLNPQRINEQTWYYEHPKTIEVVREVFDSSGRYIKTDVFKLPIHRLQKSIRRIQS